MKCFKIRALDTWSSTMYSSRFDKRSIWFRNDGQFQSFGILWIGLNVLMNELTSVTVIIRNLPVGRPASISNEPIIIWLC